MCFLLTLLPQNAIFLCKSENVNSGSHFAPENASNIYLIRSTTGATPPPNGCAPVQGGYKVCKKNLLHIYYHVRHNKIKLQDKTNHENEIGVTH